MARRRKPRNSPGPWSAWSYAAEQEKPVRRKVALKIIKLGMDTKQPMTGDPVFSVAPTRSRHTYIYLTVPAKCSANAARVQRVTGSGLHSRVQHAVLAGGVHGFPDRVSGFHAADLIAEARTPVRYEERLCGCRIGYNSSGDPVLIDPECGPMRRCADLDWRRRHILERAELEHDGELLWR